MYVRVPIRGYGQEQSTREVPETILEERIVRATDAAEEAAYQAHINAALAQQASDLNKQVIVGFMGAGIVAVMMWGIAQAIQIGGK